VNVVAPRTLPALCASCGLFNAAQTYCVPGQAFDNTVGLRRADGPVDLLVVLGNPSPPVDASGKILTDRAGEWLQEDWLSCWDGTYAVTYATRCHAPKTEDEVKIKPHQIRACEPFLSADISRLQPKVILCLGLVALQAVWPNGPDTLTKARQAPSKVGESWVVTSFDPYQHVAGIRNLNDEYKRTFEIVDRIFHGLFEQDHPDLRVIESDQDLQTCLRQLGRATEVSFDFETDTDDGIPGKQSIWMPDARPVCMAVCTSTSADVPVWIAQPQHIPYLVPALYGKTVLQSNCLTDDHQILLADGSKMTLGQMVRQKHPGPVLTLNENTGRIEPKAVIGWIHAGSRAWAEWRRIRVQGKGVLSLTEDHEVLTTRGRVRADQIRLGDYIYTGKQTLTEPQKALLYGSLMGDGSLVRQKEAQARSHYFKVSHAAKQHAYLDWKASILGETLIRKVWIDPPNNRGFSNNTILKTLRTVSDARFDALATTAVRKNQALTLSQWENITPAALAVWFMDDGSNDHGRVDFCTTNHDTERLQMALCDRGFWFYIYEPPRRNARYKQAKRLIIPAEKSATWWEMIAAYIPPCMQYKLPQQYRGRYNADLWQSSVSPQAFADVVVEVGPLVKPQGGARYTGRTLRPEVKGPGQYCLQVEGNRNFFASGLAVSNCKYDINCIAWWYDRGIWDKIGDIEDVMLWHASLDQGKAGNGLVDMAVRYLGMTNWKQGVWNLVNEETLRRRKLKISPSKATVANIPSRPVYEMCGRDVFAAMRLLDHFRKHLPAGEAYRSLLIPFTFLTGRIELNGLGIDHSLVARLRDTVEAKVAEIQAWLEGQPEVRRVLASRSHPALELLPPSANSVVAQVVRNKKTEPFNCWSPIDIEHLLVETDLEVEQKTKKARVIVNGVEVQRSVQDKDVMAELATKSKLWAAVHAQRQYRSLLSKYVDSYPLYAAKDGRIHADFVVCKSEVGGFSAGSDATGSGTDTGRWSCRRPNLFNVKKRPENPAEDDTSLARVLFGPTELDRLMAELDVGQIEPRIGGVFAEDTALIAACQEGDLYKNMCAEVHNKPVASVTKAERTLMKTGVLAAVLYGQSEVSFARQQNIPLHEAVDFFQKTRLRFRRLWEWSRSVIEHVRAGRMLVSPFGRMYSIEYTGDPKRDAHADRKAINCTIQGAGADIVGWQADRIDRMYREQRAPAWFVNLVYDSHVLEMRKDAARELLRVHKRMMEDTSVLPISMPVAMPVEVMVGPNMGFMEVIEV